MNFLISQSMIILSYVYNLRNFEELLKKNNWFFICLIFPKQFKLFVEMDAFRGGAFHHSFEWQICLYILQKEEEFVFTDIFERPVPSLLRGYSAPIRLESDLTDDDLFFLLANDSDEFNRSVFF